MPLPKIPRSELRQGILTCLSVASLRLSEAEVLLANEFLTQSTVVFSFAVEEFGKAVLLREAYESGTDPVTNEDFYEHRAKLEAAGRHIDGKHLLLNENGAFQADAFQADAFDVGDLANLDARLSGLYVDWDDAWVYGAPRVDVEVLKRSIEGVSRAITKAVIEWT